MKAAYYTKSTSEKAVLHVGDVDGMEPGPNEVQVEIFYSGINPGELSKGVLQPGEPMPYPFIIPHSDGAGIVRKAGLNVADSLIGKKVLCFGAQSYRAYGTAAEYCTLPVLNVVELTEKTSLIQAAQMGIPAMTGYMSIFKAGNPNGKIVLVNGGAGAVGQCAIQFARRAGALVLATVTRSEDIEKAKAAGASDVFILSSETEFEIRLKYPEGIHHVSEVSFDNNVTMDVALLRNFGTIAVYASKSATPQIPFWPMVFNNISVFFLGSDDFSNEEKRASMEEAVKALDDGWQGLEIAKIFKLDDIVEAHQFIANRTSSKRVLISLKD